MDKVWHYAPWAYLPEMVATGTLRPSNAGAPAETAMLWFSSNQRWEPTATKFTTNAAGQATAMTFTQQARSFGCIRLGLDAGDPRLMNWKESCKAAGTPRESRRALEAAGKKQGAHPSHWFATMATIQLKELHFQVWNDGWLNATSPQDMAFVWTSAQGARVA